MQDKEIYISKLQEQDPDKIADLYAEANSCTENVCGNKVFLRGLVEFSNVCEKDCYYCGVRRSRFQGIKRYTMSAEEIIQCALFAHKEKYGSIVLQSGEVSSKPRIDFVARIIEKIIESTNGELRVVLSIGELPREAYAVLKRAGVSRYLLRIETSNEQLYKQLHPANHSFQRRMQALKDLKDLGYQVGTGVMIGLPGQTLEDLVEDLFFFRDIDIDMIGMGPYLPDKNTPLGQRQQDYNDEQRLTLSFKMVALARLMLRDVNIAATTAMGTLHPRGKEIALTAGANVIMPQITPKQYHHNYRIYDNKVNIALKSMHLDKINKQIAWGEYGDPKHFVKRTT